MPFPGLKTTYLDDDCCVLWRSQSGAQLSALGIRKVHILRKQRTVENFARRGWKEAACGLLCVPTHTQHQIRLGHARPTLRPMPAVDSIVQPEDKRLSRGARYRGKYRVRPCGMANDQIDMLMTQELS